MVKEILIFCGFLGVVSCGTATFTGAEKTVIEGGGAVEAVRVLQITDPLDSVLLRTPCTDLRRFAGDTTLNLLIARMKSTLYAADGVGIAAPQVGVSKNLFLFMRLDLPGEPVVTAINPKIIDYPDSSVCFERDGCLSIPGIQGNSVRYPWIDVAYYNEKGELIRERLEGYSRLKTFTSVIFQHEFDHLQGVLFTDKLREEPTSEP
jgi:peptide deformylase